MDAFLDALLESVDICGVAGIAVLHWLGDNWDKFAQSVSALIVAGVALYGMVYTVIPLFSKALLEEQKAELERQIPTLQEAVATLGRKTHELESGRTALLKGNQALEQRNALLEESGQRLQREKANLESQLGDLGRQVEHLTYRAQDYQSTFAASRRYATKLLLSSMAECAAGLLLLAKEAAEHPERHVARWRPLPAEGEYAKFLELRRDLYPMDKGGAELEFTGLDVMTHVAWQSAHLTPLETEDQHTFRHFVQQFSTERPKPVLWEKLYEAPVAPMTAEEKAAYLTRHEARHERFRAALYDLNQFLSVHFAN